ncbi:6803_t:CDS:2 [Entrophospora sp. SA101]|nr:6803_t:CDS:2 [Entrophospora sp. SA101]
MFNWFKSTGSFQNTQQQTANDPSPNIFQAINVATSTLQYKNQNTKNPLFQLKLDTPEVIAKWIEERKKRYPTEANIARKRKLEEEKKAHEFARPNSNNDLFNRKKHYDKVCIKYRQGHCPKGNDCQNLHKGKLVSPPIISKVPDHKRVHCRNLREMLLYKETVKEKNVILQCLRYIVKKKFFGIATNRMLQEEKNKGGPEIVEMK